MMVFPPTHPVASRLLAAVAWAVLAFTLPAFAQSELISLGSSWKYLDTGDSLWINWRAPEFDDQRWKTGHAKLGYGAGDEATLIST